MQVLLNTDEDSNVNRKILILWTLLKTRGQCFNAWHVGQKLFFHHQRKETSESKLTIKQDAPKEQISAG